MLFKSFPHEFQMDTKNCAPACPNNGIAYAAIQAAREILNGYNVDTIVSAAQSGSEIRLIRESKILVTSSHMSEVTNTSVWVDGRFVITLRDH